ncbi:MAG: type III-A CRISPR-associated protein Cas10/Csm1 [Ignavibacteriaceae bacterium]|nr:type III-A CRISPR-associated protein Cas10/Csm1 [Ignavibacteriaceae bacterium]
MANENKTHIYSAEEKILILAGLFHDIGKFEQRCTDARVKHQELGERFVKEFDEQFIKILDGSSEDFAKLCTAIREHHNKQADELTQYIRQADHLSSSQRVELDLEDLGDKPRWGHKYLSSVFAKLALNSPDEGEERKKLLKYYKQKPLVESNYSLLIPSLEDVTNEAAYRYGKQDFKNFKEDLGAIFSIYEKPEDFDTLIRLLMLYFEKYLWCVPDFTGSEETDISLYNHSKDVAAAAHALYKAEAGSDGNRKLNLVIGDIPGIQNYIFNITNTKPAKVLRGRSVFVQVLTRVFASRFLEELGLSEVNVIMLAGGKFYILAPQNIKFKERYEAALDWCEDYMKNNFYYELSFSAGYETFDPEELKNKTKSFGDIVEEASHNLLKTRSSVFEGEFLVKGFDAVLNEKYIQNEGGDSDSIKCAITGKPIRKKREQPHEEYDEDLKRDIVVGLRDKQAGNELELGKSIVYEATVIEYSPDFRDVKSVKLISDWEKTSEDRKRIIINPNYDDFNGNVNNNKDLIRGAYFLHVANFASQDSKKNVMDFETMEKTNQGAKMLTMIKGDIDNLGLLMATGLYSDGKDYTGFSRTTSLSYHLRYFFSTFFNNFLKKWEGKGAENKVYTVFAGGDDLLFITPHGSSLELLQEINNKFKEFVCSNPEVHISYSLTNFKHNTPVRLVNEFAEEAQAQAKSKNKKKQVDLSRATCFYPEENKASVVVHDTVVKNKQIPKIIEQTKDLMEWISVNDKDNPVSMGVVRALLQLTGIMQEYLETKRTEKLMFYPQLTYLINRLLKDGSGKYKIDNEETRTKVGKLFDKAVSINQSDEDKKKFFAVLKPALCEAIYKLRTSGDNNE